MAAPAAAIEKPANEKPANEKTGSDAGKSAAAVGEKRDGKSWEEAWKPVLDLQCDLSVDLPMPDFKIGDLLKLRQGSVINAQFKLGRDVPLLLNAMQIGWVEFEVVGERLAVRLTELA
jgi:flagellar motor switch/type III secretory pathway protein FliN